ncbi:MAG: COG1361 S-layer family protein [Methanoculleaceae archaeon]
MTMRSAVFIGLFCLALVLVPAVRAGTADVTVTGTDLEPEVLMRGDLGTLSVTVTNTGSEAVEIARALLFDRDIDLIRNPYPSVGDLGAGNSRTFDFVIRADVEDGYYYPTLEIQFTSGNSLRMPVLVRVDDTDLHISVTDLPETFYAGKRSDITVSVGNPRPNEVRGVSVMVRGDGVDVRPTSRFIGTIAPDGKADVVFNITPSKATTLEIIATCYNGPNLHRVRHNLTIPFETPKKAGDPRLSNIGVETTGSSYRVRGDVINAGLDTAYSVVIAPAPPAEPVDPFREYVVGSLEPDDFSSFEVTFDAEPGEIVPLVVRFTDEDGNAFERRVAVGIPVATGAAPDGWSGPVLPAAAVVVCCAVVVAAAIAWSWKGR